MGDAVALAGGTGLLITAFIFITGFIWLDRFAEKNSVNPPFPPDWDDHWTL